MPKRRKRGNPQFKYNSRRRENLIKIIFDCLPAYSFRDLTESVNEITPVTDSMISGTVEYIRKTFSENPNKYGWTIPHTKRGRNPDTTNMRIFALLSDRKDDYFHDGDRRQINLIEGNNATFMQALQQFLNQSASFQIALEYYRGSSEMKLQAKMILFILGYLVSEIQKFIDTKTREKKEADKSLIDAWKGNGEAA